VNPTLARLRRLTTDQTTRGDGPLLEAFLAGDQNAFAILVRRHAGLVFSTCRRILRHHQDAEDAFQATFLVLARRAADVWPREAVSAWLFGVARRVALKALTMRERRITREYALQEVAAGEPSQAEYDLIEAVHRAICKLPEVYRLAVVACDLEGLTRKEAAERLGWSEGTLSGRLARARGLLAKRLQRLGLALPVGGLAAFGPAEIASAHVIQSTIELISGTPTAGASASVVALSEGMVRSMTFVKLKAMTAALLTVCAIGFGVLAASGAGTGSGEEPNTPQTRGEQDRPLVPVPLKPVDPVKKRVPPPKKLGSDRDRLQGTWWIVRLKEGDKTISTGPAGSWVLEVENNVLRMPYLEGGRNWKQREYTFTVNETARPRTLNMHVNSSPGGQLKWGKVEAIYEFVAPSSTCVLCHQNPYGKELPSLLPPCEPALKDPAVMAQAELRLALTVDGQRPKEFGGDGVIVFHLKRPNPQDEAREKLLRETKRLEEALCTTADDQKKAEYEALLRQARAQLELQAAQEELRQAEAELEMARAQVALAQAKFERSNAQLHVAKERVKQAQQAVAAANQKSPGLIPVKEGIVFTVHVRTLTAPEKTIRVKATGKETVLEGLVYAADDAPITSGGVNVWVVRDKAILPVNLPGILKGGEMKTNYTLKAGDQLFVQVKAEK